MTKQTPIAIVGMASVFPKARNLSEYWDNILNKVDCITDIPVSRWNIEDYYDPSSQTPDTTYSKRGGFIPEVDFDPLAFGIPPNTLEFIDVSQLLALVVARDALTDAGYADASEDVRARTGVILGVGGGQKLMFSLSARMQYPIWERVLRSRGVPEDEIATIIDNIKLAYVPWKEDAFPGMLGNVVAGRIANRLDLGGINCVVDAACATSLAAIKMAVSELASGQVDMMISGGVDTDNSILMYMSFNAVGALSHGDHSRPFDENADGTVMGEGIGMVVMKRLEDAERDGDRIYAVIKGVGASSDGRYKSIYAPRATGQEQALARAYAAAEVPPETVGLIEAHGTGTVAGDLTEFTALNQYFNQYPIPAQSVALGSVKSQIGHTKSAAGVAGVIKAALSLYHRVLPPTVNVSRVNPKFDIEHSPFYISQGAQEWRRENPAVPRRAGVSSFGFGGTNFHVVMEEYPANESESRPAPIQSHTTAAPAQNGNRLLFQLSGTNYVSDQARTKFAEALNVTVPRMANGNHEDKRELKAQLAQLQAVVDRLQDMIGEDEA